MNFSDGITETTYDKKAHRCSICNCVSIVDIQTELGDYRQYMSYVTDPSNRLHFICIDCHEAIQDVRDDFEWMDEENNDEPEKTSPFGF